MAKVTLHGEPVGRFRASWLLFKESFRFLRLDAEMLWLPVLTALLNLLLFGLLVSVFVLSAFAFSSLLESESNQQIAGVLFVFCAYVIGAFTLALSQAGIAHIVHSRAHGGDATLGEGLKRAFSHWGSLFVWSLITSTIGLILRLIAERSQLLGKLVAVLLGAAWTILTYFVVPAMVIDKVSAFRSISTSANVFKRTWGETFVANFTIGLVVFLAHVVVFVAMAGLVVLALFAELPVLIIPLVILYVVWLIAAGLVASALNGILKTLLYIYAAEGYVPENFDRELLERMLQKNHSDTQTTSSETPVTSQSSPRPPENHIANQ